MTEPKLEPIPPVSVTIIGTGNDGGVSLPSGTKAITEDHHPDIVVNVVKPIVAILVRFVNAYLTMLVSLVGAGMTTNIIPASDFIHLVEKCAILSLASAGLGFLKDLVTVFGKLEGKYPLATGSI